MPEVLQLYSNHKQCNFFQTDKCFEVLVKKRIIVRNIVRIIIVLHHSEANIPDIISF